MEIEAKNYPIAVMGAGTMGRGIAQAAASAGHPVMLYDVDEKHTQDAIEYIVQRLEESLHKGEITENSKEQIHNNIRTMNAFGRTISGQTDYRGSHRRFENKTGIILQAGICFGSGLNSVYKHFLLRFKQNWHYPETSRTFCWHAFFNPVSVMALVEIIHTAETDPSVTEFVSQLVKKWRKIPVHVRNSTGFVVNRAARPFYGEALRILMDVATDAATCDAIFRDCGGFRMGPFELIDLIGLDCEL